MSAAPLLPGLVSFPASLQAVQNRFQAAELLDPPPPQQAPSEAPSPSPSPAPACQGEAGAGEEEEGCLPSLPGAPQVGQGAEGGGLEGWAHPGSLATQDRHGVPQR